MPIQSPPSIADVTLEVAQFIRDHKDFANGTANGIKGLGDRLDAVEERIRGRQALPLEGGPLADMLMRMKVLENRPEVLGAQSVNFEIPRKAITGITVQVPQWTGVVAPLPAAPLGVRSLIPVTQTSQGAIQIIRKTAWTNNAAPVAEGAAKPESTATYTQVTVPVEAIAHWVALSKQTYSDLPTLVAELESELLYGVQEVEEEQILKGNGTTPNLTGIYPLAPALTLTPPAGATLLDEIGLAIGELANKGYRATGAVVNGADWINALLLKTTQGEYVMGAPGAMPSNRAWSIPVVISSALSTGEWLVGAWPQGARIFERESVNIQIATQHLDNFTKNMITALAELREAFVIYNVQAFVKNGAGAMATEGRRTL